MNDFECINLKWGGKLGVDFMRNLGKSNAKNDLTFVDDFWVSRDLVFADDFMSQPWLSFRWWFSVSVVTQFSLMIFCINSDLVFTDDFMC